MAAAAAAPAYRRPPIVRHFGGRCKTCQLPRAWHKVDDRGNTVLRAEYRARVGNTRPPICWTREHRYGDLYDPRTPFFGPRQVA